MYDILFKLNDYRGDAVWNIIYDVINDAATEARWDDSNSDDFIGLDGLHYGYRPSAFGGPWIIVKD